MYFTDEFGRYFKNSPTDLPTELIRRHLTVSCHQYRRIYRRIYSVGISYTHRRIYRRIFFVGQSQYHRRNENPSVYFKWESFCLARKVRL